jgi:hypothetical protein
MNAPHVSCPTPWHCNDIHIPQVRRFYERARECGYFPEDSQLPTYPVYDRISDDSGNFQYLIDPE